MKVNKHVDFLQRMMQSSALRRSVIANNVANDNVPGFKRNTVQFESMMQKALNASKLTLESFQEEHTYRLPLVEGLAMDKVQPRVVRDRYTVADPTGNNVDLERELSLERENMLKYSLMLASLKQHFTNLHTVIR